MAQLLSAAADQPVAAKPVAAGLATGQRVEDYVREVRGYAAPENRRDESVRGLVEHAFTVVSAQLDALGVPPVRAQVAPARTVANFNSRSWVITVDVTRAGAEGDEAPTIGSLTSTQLGELASHIYHEARHAEQAFREARLLAGQHLAHLQLPAESGSLLAKATQQLRGVRVRKLADDLGLPVEIMEAAAEVPLAPIPAEPLIQALVGAVVGFSDLALADVLRPSSALARAAAAAKERIAAHNRFVAEAQAWHDQRELEDLAYDRSGAIRGTLDVFTTEAAKAGTATGMDRAAIKGVRGQLTDVVRTIDRERERLASQPGRAEMHRSLGELKELLFDLGESMVVLAKLDSDADAPDRDEDIKRLAQWVELSATKVDLLLQVELYEQLLKELDAYAVASGVRSAWESGSSP